MSTPIGMSLNLQQRVDVINRHKKGDTAIAIAGALSVGKTQIQNIVYNKENMLKRYHEGEDSEAKYAKRQKNKQPNVEWQGVGLVLWR